MNTPTILQPPALDHDAMMLAQFGEEYRPGVRGKLERRVAWNLLEQLREAGFTHFELDDGEEVTVCEDSKAVMELLFNLDEARLYVGKHTPTKGYAPTHWIYFVLGNGPDIVADYGVPRSDADGFGPLMDAFDGEDYA